MHRQVLQLRERHETEDEAERANDDAAHQQRAPVDAHEVDRRQIRQHEVRFAARFRRRRAFGRLRGQCGTRHRRQRHRDQHREQCANHQSLNRSDHRYPRVTPFM